MNMPNIDADIPIPRGRGAGRPARYPFADLEIGQSFWILETKSRVAAAAWSYGMFKGRKKRFMCREENGGTRCWRVPWHGGYRTKP